MKSVIYLPDTAQKEQEKPVEFTHYASQTGWEVSCVKPKHYDKIIYLGNSSNEGELFAAYLDGTITIYKGHLNSGKY